MVLVYFEDPDPFVFQQPSAPLPVEPNNILAPLWGDLSLDPLDPAHYPAGNVYTLFPIQLGPKMITL